MILLFKFEVVLSSYVDIVILVIKILEILVFTGGL